MQLFEAKLCFIQIWYCKSTPKYQFNACVKQFIIGLLAINFKILSRRRG